MPKRGRLCRMTKVARQASIRDGETDARSEPSLKYVLVPSKPKTTTGARTANTMTKANRRLLKNPIAQDEKTNPARDPRIAPREKVASTPSRHRSAARKYRLRN